MLVVIVGLSVTGLFSYDLFFAASFIGFLVIAEMTAPVNVTPQWRRRLMWVTVAGFAVFLLLVSRRFVEIIPSEVVPL